MMSPPLLPLLMTDSDEEEDPAATKVGARSQRGENRSTHGAVMARPKARSRMGKETHALRETETGQAKRRRRPARRLTAKQREEIPMNATMELFGASPTMGERQTLPDGTPTLYSGADLERLKVTLMVRSVAEGTNKTYSTG